MDSSNGNIMILQQRSPDYFTERNNSINEKSVPSKSSFAMQALVAKHFMWGGYYPDGGSAEIARTLLKTVADHGGWTRICADVEEILVEDGVAVGVRVNGEELRAARIVSACGILSTVERLLPAPYKDAGWAKETKQLKLKDVDIDLERLKINT